MTDLTQASLASEAEGFEAENLKRKVICFLALFSVLLSGLAYSSPPVDLWRANALYCSAELNGTNPTLVGHCGASSSRGKESRLCFPTKGGEPNSQPCDDGDMALFSGLLCSAGIVEGCDAVVKSQDPNTGQWFRSPRRRALGSGAVANSFSPDMAIGLYHWLASSHDSISKSKFEAWVEWLSRNKRCLDATCTKKWPRFCPDDDVDLPGAEYGCTMRPGDLATLGIVAEKLGIEIKDRQIRELAEKWKDSAVGLAWISAHTNEVGYRLHLAASVIFLYQRLGVDDDALSDAALSLITRQPQNPFFAYVHGDRKAAASLALSLCPKSQESIAPSSGRYQWSWEREDAEEAWKHSMLWECIFISNLPQ